MKYLKPDKSIVGIGLQRFVCIILFLCMVLFFDFFEILNLLCLSSKQCRHGLFFVCNSGNPSTMLVISCKVLKLTCLNLKYHRSIDFSSMRYT